MKLLRRNETARDHRHPSAWSEVDFPHHWVCRVLSVLLVGWFVTLPTRGLELPPGFVAETLVDHIDCAVAFAVVPDGRIFYVEQTGALRVWKEGRVLPEPVLDVSARLDTYWERGLIGVTFHPDFPRTPHVFVLYVAKEPYVHHVLSRFTMKGDVADPASEQILLEGDDQHAFGGPVPAGHQGGPLRFGADGKLYVALGEQTARDPAQSLHALQGKMLRINPDGSIPEDNPFYTKTSGKYRSIWTIGMRNPFGIAVQPGTGRMLVSDVGESSWEEVDEILPGENYGWPEAEGISKDPRFRNPIYTYPPVLGRCIAGGTFYPKSPTAAPSGAALFPEEWRGKFLFADWANGWVKALDLDAPQNVTTFARGLENPVALESAPDGSLIVLNRGTIWRDPKKFKPNSGSLVRIRFTGQVTETSAGSRKFPATLAASELFASLAPLAPRQEFQLFEVNLSPWQPGVRVRRWISLPAGAHVHRIENGEWDLPKGTVVIQHYEIPHGTEGSPFETHLFWITGPRTARAAAYRWKGVDAALVSEAQIVPLGDAANHRWFTPAPEEALNLDAVAMGFFLPVNGRQLNRDILDQVTGRNINQITLWNQRGLFDPAFSASDLAALPRLAAPDDTETSPEQRVRSYLDVNCAGCHHPGGLARAVFDARCSIPLDKQGLIDGPLISGDAGVPGNKVIVPGSLDKSILYQRLKRTDPARMPPVAVNDDPQPILPVLEQWIQLLKAP